MYLLILLPFLIVTTIAGILSMIYENPDEVLNGRHHYVDIEANTK